MSRTISADAFSEPAAIHGRIGARIDRLPLTAVQWRLAMLVEVTSASSFRYRLHRRAALPLSFGVPTAHRCL